MKTYRFALVPRQQNLYKAYKKPIEHFLRVLLKRTGARIQRLEKASTYVYIRVLMPEGTDAQAAIAWVKRESAAALCAMLKKAGFMYGDKLDLWREAHYVDERDDERDRGAMETFVIDELLSERQKKEIVEYAKRKGAAV